LVGSGIRDPRSWIWDPGWGKIRIRDKHPGSAALVVFIRNLESSNQEVPKDLLELAMQSSWFKNSRYKKGRGKGVGGAGLGYRERAAIGFEEAADSQVGKNL